MNKIVYFLLLSMFAVSCQESLEQNGVSLQLAQQRADNISNLEYEIFFDVPKELDRSVRGEVKLKFNLKRAERVVLDFKTDMIETDKAIVNNELCDISIHNEHIVIPEKYVVVGENSVVIYFDAPNTSLNRREDFLYTLLVPDRARTLFPCFDQPNLKAEFLLRLAVPIGWDAIANGSVQSIDTIENNRICVYTFNKTEPISTYLFSFVVGKFDSKQYTKNNRSINIYYRESDPDKIVQLDDIAKEVFYSLDWFEKYTAIPYPFEKYDLVIVPGFQYGGMEHMGATLYNSNTMLLQKDPSLNARMARSSLIAHETGHMWFGDYVTMDWFNNVWNKEVFANYYAAEVLKELYPQVDSREGFMKYFPSAYSEDRTLGATPLTQPLENLEDAGLVYGKIIYNKAPIVMQMMVEMMGKQNYDEGIREYLQLYGYGNASWDDLVSVLDSHTHVDLKGWSRVWVNTAGMPTVESAIVNDSLFVVQHDPLNRDIVWTETVTFLAVGADFAKSVELEMTKNAHSLPLPKGTKYVIPNSDMKAYGFFVLDSLNMGHAMWSISKFSDPIVKHSILNNLYENMLNNYLSPEHYSLATIHYLQTEREPLLFSKAIDNLYFTYSKCDMPRKITTSIERFLLGVAESDPEPSYRRQVLNLLISGAKSNSTRAKLLDIYRDKDKIKAVGDEQRISLAYTLSIYFPELAEDILEKQLSEIVNPDKRKEFEFVSQAVVPDSVARNKFFMSLLKAENRSVEPWTLKALSLLNHNTRQNNTLWYIRPALDILPEIQKTGDIFFPQDWVAALLSGHTSQDAKDVVEAYILDNEDKINPMLMNKVKQRAYHLFR